MIIPFKFIPLIFHIYINRLPLPRNLPQRLLGLCIIVLLAACNGNGNDDPAPAAPAPTIASFTPASGPVGTSVTITGTNFAATASDNTVTFNGTAASVTLSSPTSLRATVPTGATSGKITITVANQTATSSADFTVTPAAPASPAPAITGFTPASGPVGTSVTITGTNFSTTPAQNSVAFNGTAAVVTAATATSITTTVPTGATTGKISVTVGTLAATSANNFTVTVPAPAPTGTVTTFASSGPSGAFGTVYDVVVDGTGNVYATVDNSVYTITSAGGVSLLAGGAIGTVNGTGAAARFNSPEMMLILPNTDLLVSDVFNQSIRRVTTAGVATTFAGAFSTNGFGSVNGPALSAKFDRPRGLASDAAGNIYVADYRNDQIRKITPAGVVSTFAGSTTPGYLDATGTAARFQRPTDLAIDAAGNLYVTEHEVNRIRKITPGGVVTTFAGTTGVNDPGSFADGTGTSARFSSPWGIAIDNSGNLYVADQGNNRIRKITLGGVVTTFAGSGTQGNQNGPLSSAQFRSPTGIAVGPGGVIYVADQGNSVIRKITP